VISAWEAESEGLLILPSGRTVRGRGLRRPLPAAGQEPTFALYLLGHEPPTVAWESRWLRWPDFRLPSDPAVGRTGTALSCLAVLDGLPPRDAIAYVREHYTRRAVETPWQRRFVERFR